MACAQQKWKALLIGLFMKFGAKITQCFAFGLMETANGCVLCGHPSNPMKIPLLPVLTGLFCILAALAWVKLWPSNRTLTSVGQQVATTALSVKEDSLLSVHLPAGAKIDSIVVLKHLRLMTAYYKGVALKQYRIALGDAPEGHKHFRGDERTPEGLYCIADRNPNSICHKNLGISYPNPTDRAYAQAHGLPAGGDVKIHGLPNGQGAVGAAHVATDWTNGCVAVTDEEMDELFKCVKLPSPILILP